MTQRSYAALDLNFLAKGLYFCQHLTDDFRVTDNADVMWFKGICYGLRGNIPNGERGASTYEEKLKVALLIILIELKF